MSAIKPPIMVGSQLEVENFLEHPSVICPVISLIGSTGESLKHADRAKWVAEIRLDDLESPVGGYVHPTCDHAEQIWAAWDKAKSEHVPAVIIHCHAGISRSPAAALAILFWEMAQQGGVNEATSVAAVDELLKIRPICLPNRLLLAEMLKLKNPDGIAWAGRLADWVKLKTGDAIVRLTPEERAEQ